MKYEAETRPWGMYQVLLDSDATKVKLITIAPNSRLSLQSHDKRQEQWTLVKGTLTVVLDDIEYTLAATGDPMQALAYGAADALGSTAAIGGTRRLAGTKRKRTYDIDPKTGMAVNPQTVIEPRKREMAANVIGSAAASIPVTLAFSGAQPQVQGQQTQIAQQQVQRSVVNNQMPEQLAGKYFNNTMLQSVEGPSIRAQAVQASNAYFDPASAAATMGSIMGI